MDAAAAQGLQSTALDEVWASTRDAWAALYTVAQTPMVRDLDL